MTLTDPYLHVRSIIDALRSPDVRVELDPMNATNPNDSRKIRDIHITAGGRLFVIHDDSRPGREGLFKFSEIDNSPLVFSVTIALKTDATDSARIAGVHQITPADSNLIIDHIISILEQYAAGSVSWRLEHVEAKNAEGIYGHYYRNNVMV